MNNTMLSLTRNTSLLQNKYLVQYEIIIFNQISMTDDVEDFDIYIQQIKG